jgi:DNA-binding NtrC family response regulator
MTATAVTESRTFATLGLLIAAKDAQVRREMTDIFGAGGYSVVTVDSAANALEQILRRTAQVVLLGNELDDWTAADLVPLLRKCNPDVTIIVVSDEASLVLERKLRKEGIFYHALRPTSSGDREEIRQAVQCAFEAILQRRNLRGAHRHLMPTPRSVS